MAQQNENPIEDIFKFIASAAGHPAVGILYNIFVKTPEDQKRFEQYLTDQGIVGDQLNEIRKSVGLPQIATEGTQYAATQGKLESKKEQLAKLQAALEADPAAAKRPDNVRNLKNLTDEIASLEASIGPDPNSALEQYKDTAGRIGEEAEYFKSSNVDERLKDALGPANATLNSILPNYNAATASTQAGYDALYSKASGLVQNLGNQERADINERADATASANQAALAARGLGGTTVTTSQNAMNERERTAELGRLNERLIREQLGVESTFGLAGLGFQERNNQFGANLGLGVTSGQTGLGTFQFGAQNEGQAAYISYLKDAGLLPANFQFDLANSSIGQPPQLQYIPSNAAPIAQPNYGTVN